MSKKKKASAATLSDVSEPSVNYGGERLQFFNSFEEMDEADARQMAALTPIEHLQNATELIKRAYSKELKEYLFDKRIYYK